MYEKITRNSVPILALIGGAWVVIQLFSLFNNLFLQDEFEKLEDEYYESMSRSYERGLWWGWETSTAYDTETIDGVNYNETNMEVVIAQIYQERLFDWTCVGPNPGDCLDLPTEEEIRERYSVEKYYHGDNAPVEAFKSGFRDGFYDGLGMYY
mgnify:CR=1 FL=1